MQAFTTQNNPAVERRKGTFTCILVNSDANLAACAAQAARPRQNQAGAATRLHRFTFTNPDLRDGQPGEHKGKRGAASRILRPFPLFERLQSRYRDGEN